MEFALTWLDLNTRPAVPAWVALAVLPHSAWDTGVTQQNDTEVWKPSAVWGTRRRMWAHTMWSCLSDRLVVLRKQTHIQKFPCSISIRKSKTSSLCVKIHTQLMCFSVPLPPSLLLVTATWAFVWRPCVFLNFVTKVMIWTLALDGWGHCDFV